MTVKYGGMEAYADESGIHNGSTRCLVAGYTGGKGQWRSFEPLWKEALLEFGVPLDEGFHAKTFFKKSHQGQRFGPYAGWPDDKADKFLERLIGVIRTHRIYPVGALLDIVYFNSLSMNKKKWLTGGVYDEEKRSWVQSGAPSKPYFMPFHAVIVDGAAEAKANINVDFIFDRQDQFSRHALNLWNHMKDKLVWETGKHLGGIEFRGRTDRVALQAADLLAFCHYHVDEYRIGTKRPEIAYALHYLYSNRTSVKKYDDTGIGLILQGYPGALATKDEKESPQVIHNEK